MDHHQSGALAEARRMSLRAVDRLAFVALNAHGGHDTGGDIACLAGHRGVSEPLPADNGARRHVRIA